MPCSEKRARQLLERGRARVHTMYPFTMRLLHRLVEDSVVEGVVLKIDPGSKVLARALVCEEGSIAHACSFFCVRHRGEQIHVKMVKRAASRRRRRSADLRYREKRFSNRRRPKGWLAPSIRHRVESTVNFAAKLLKIAPIRGFYIELAKFDTQKMQNPDISGVEYQQGTLFDYEIREYLLEKWGRECVYCGKEDAPLEIEHIVPKSRGGSDRILNPTLACHECNQAKNNYPVEDFLKKKPALLAKILKQAQIPLKDAAAMNATRLALYTALQHFGLPIHTALGGRTKWSRIRLGIPKSTGLTHCAF